MKSRVFSKNHIPLSRFRRFLFAATLIVAQAACAAPELPPAAPLGASSFSKSDIATGAELSALGDCSVCHTARDGRTYAGGRAIPTPFGNVFSTNITPDQDTGIGTWSLAAFTRAMRDGIARDGRHLYPVLPYPHFIRATDSDIAALYAFLMTREPVSQKSLPNKLAFPANFRPLLMGWNTLYLRRAAFRPDHGHDSEWNRGAYLVDAIGHCGACHTPHNILGAEKSGQTFAGGEAEGWYAPPLMETGSPGDFGVRSWSVDALGTYLRTGIDGDHGVAAGPMGPVIHQMDQVPDQDVHAIAAYIASLAQRNSDATRPVPAPSQVTDPRAEAMFDGACGACHAANAPMTESGAPGLGASAAVNAPTPNNVVEVILHGIPFREGRAGPYMPAFGSVLTDAQVASLAIYVRARYTARPAWPNVEASVRAARRQGDGS